MSYWAIAGYIFHLHTILRAEPTAEGGRKKKKLVQLCGVCVRESRSEEKRQRKTEERESKMQSTTTSERLWFMNNTVAQTVCSTVA